MAPAGLGLLVIREHIPVFPETEAICRALALGEVHLLSEGIKMVTNGAVEPLAPPVRDEIARALEDG